jgi:hypothetical protein
MNGLIIIPAEHGGFVVRDAGGDPGRFSALLFAGSLDDCLEFIGGRLSELPPSAPEVRKAA